MKVITRFAPSPTGHLHLGHAYSAWLAWSRARAIGGSFRLRLEDIDAERCTPQFARAIIEDLQWLGLDWDGEVRLQSVHMADYRAALDRLDARGLVYPCFCSRAEIAQALTAPHNLERKYPGTCRNRSAEERLAQMAMGKNFAWRLNAGLALREVGEFGFYEEDVSWIDGRPDFLSDVVLARRALPASYHLCVVHDDALQQISHVIRGRDLFEVTHVHVLLQRLLGLPTPIYLHHQLLTNAAGERLSKRDKAASLRDMRQAGIPAAAVLKQLRELSQQHDPA